MGLGQVVPVLRINPRLFEIGLLTADANGPQYLLSQLPECEPYPEWLGLENGSSLMK